MHKVVIYQSEKSGEYYWRIVASNGQTVATGGEGFKTKANCCNSVLKVIEAAENKTIDKSQCE